MLRSKVPLENCFVVVMTVISDTNAVPAESVSAVFW